MLELKNTTKKAQGYINSYFYAVERGIDSLNKCYSKCSIYKEQAFNDIKNRDNKVVYIISYNINFFSTAYRNNNDLMVDTPTNTYLIKNVF